jgi:hypothetical protein
MKVNGRLSSELVFTFRRAQGMTAAGDEYLLAIKPGTQTSAMVQFMAAGP